MKSQKHIHFIGIAGIGMSAIAGICHKRGFKVSGCDILNNKNTARLQEKGIEIYLGHSPSHLAGCDIVVYSSAIPQDCPELLEAKKRKLEVLSRGAMLARIIKEKKYICISGSHGKTTTTWMIAWLLKCAHKDPSMLLGGVPISLNSNFLYGKGDYIVVETDESDGSFLYFEPEIGVITNIDKEHLDYYKSFKELKEAFKNFIENTKGIVVINRDNKELFSIGKKYEYILTYSLTSKEADAYAYNIKEGSQGSIFDVKIGSNTVKNVKLNLLGRHNIENALASMLVGRYLNIDISSIKKALRSIPNIKRRFEIKGKVNGITIVEDYAHHPTEIKATLKVAKDLGGNRIVVVFQPHRYTRTSLLMEDFVEVLKDVDVLVLMDIYSASESPIKGVNTFTLYKKLCRYNSNVYYLPSRNAIIDFLKMGLIRGDIVIFMGAGDVGLLSENLLGVLKGTHE